MGVYLSVESLINCLIIAIGIGICLLNILQIRTGSHQEPKTKAYFQTFFLVLFTYITAHLARELMSGVPGRGVHIAQYVVTFTEFAASGFMAYLFSRLILYIAKPEKHEPLVRTVLICALVLDLLLLVVSQFTALYYYFDAENVYHRSPAYLLSNLAHVVMLALNIYLLSRYREKFRPRVRLAFWVYTLAPLAAIGLQAVASGVQFIILATIAAAAYMFSVITHVEAERFETQQAEANRIGAELDMATRIQASMLPNLFPAFPKRKEFDLYATMHPAKEVGGDFYDFFMIGEDRLALAVADVSGKGVPAALFSMIAKTLLKTQAQTWADPARVLREVNASLSENDDENMFVTAWFGVLEISTGMLTFADAGHVKLLLYQNGEWKYLPKAGGLALAMLPPEKVERLDAKHQYRNCTIRLTPGDVIFQYTDGVTEATDADVKMFGEEKLLDAMKRAPSTRPEELLPHVRAEIDAFVKSAPQFDDITMLGLRYQGTENR